MLYYNFLVESLHVEDSKIRKKKKKTVHASNSHYEPLVL